MPNLVTELFLSEYCPKVLACMTEDLSRTSVELLAVETPPLDEEEYLMPNDVRDHTRRKTVRLVAVAD